MLTDGSDHREALNEDGLRTAVEALGTVDSDLQRIAERHGMPPLWPREPGFRALVQLILEQQVSLSSAQAALIRLTRATGQLEADILAKFDERALREAGLSRQKSRYLVGLAAAIQNGDLDLDTIACQSDVEARRNLMRLTGIGPWTASAYLLFALRRPDVWPSNDLALAASVQHVKGLSGRPSFSELDLMAERWRPYRAVAARLLWHSHLAGGRPGRTMIARTSSRP